jgi:hypothetical protein
MSILTSASGDEQGDEISRLRAENLKLALIPELEATVQSLRERIAELTTSPRQRFFRMSGKLVYLRVSNPGDNKVVHRIGAVNDQEVYGIMKDYQKRELVNELTAAATRFSGTQQLRERISRVELQDYLDTIKKEIDVLANADRMSTGERFNRGQNLKTLIEKLYAPPQSEHHPDDVAVDRFSEAMKQKLGMARSKGRGDWQTCNKEDLSRMLREHVEKGDPRDVANFCMFLWSLGHGIAQSEEPAARGDSVAWYYEVNGKVHLETRQLDHYHLSDGEYVKGRPLVFGDTLPSQSKSSSEANQPLTNMLDYELLRQYAQYSNISYSGLCQAILDAAQCASANTNRPALGLDRLRPFVHGLGKAILAELEEEEASIIKGAVKCQHVWSEESKQNGWRSTCNICGKEAAGGGQ